MRQNLKEKPWFLIVSFIMIILLSGEVVLLAIQNKKLKATIESFTNPTYLLKTGDKAESINVKTLNGYEDSITYNDSTKRYLLFILSTNCPHCLNNLPKWKEIAYSQYTENVDIFGISISELEETKKYYYEKDVSFNLLVPDTSFSRKYKISGVPLTLMVSGSGFIDKSWIGELNENQVNEIKGLLGVILHPNVIN
mgnify:CR=1 FL=1